MIRVLAPLLFTAPLLAGFPTPQEALAQVFPGAELTRREHFLTEPQAKEVRELAHTELPGYWTVAYEARKGGKLVGLGFFDTHRVRTLPETVLVALAPEGRVLRVEVVAFREPEEYRAKEAWVRQLEGRQLDNELSLKRGIRPLAGATLTANALTDATRRCLALQKVLYGAAR